jgi:predicted nucleic-acid-binding protein
MLQLDLPAFAVYVLRYRAKKQRQTVEEVIEAMLWNGCDLEEAQNVARESSLATRAFQEWLTFAYNTRQQRRK